MFFLWGFDVCYLHRVTDKDRRTGVTQETKVFSMAVPTWEHSGCLRKKPGSHLAPAQGAKETSDE